MAGFPRGPGCIVATLKSLALKAQWGLVDEAERLLRYHESHNHVCMSLSLDLSLLPAALEKTDTEASERPHGVIMVPFLSPVRRWHGHNMVAMNINMGAHTPHLICNVVNCALTRCERIMPWSLVSPCHPHGWCCCQRANCMMATCQHTPGIADAPW